MLPLNRNLTLAAVIGIIALAAAGGVSWWVLDQRHKKAEAARLAAEAETPIGLPQNAANVAVPWDKVIEELRFSESAASIPPMAISPLAAEQASTTVETTPRWMTNAAPPPPLADDAMRVAIVLDDMGVNVEQTEKALLLPPQITFAFLPYGRGTATQAQKAKDLGHEIMVHLPMEPFPRKGDEHGSYQIDPGPNALFINLPASEIATRTEVNLKDLLPLVVGVNNHMGSRFTGYRDGMKTVLDITQKYGLFFMDSVTTGKSQVKAAAEGMSLPILERNIFIDHFSDKERLERALARIEKYANSHRNVIAIGHPHQSTLDALNAWIPTLAEKNIHLVPITEMVRQEHKTHVPHTNP